MYTLRASTLACTPTKIYCPTHIEELSASRSDGVFEQRHAHGLRRGLKAKYCKNCLYFLTKNTSFLETLGKVLLFWLLMRYYEGSSRNDLYRPFGFET